MEQSDVATVESILSRERYLQTSHFLSRHWCTCCCRYFERSCWLPVLDVVPVTETAGVGRQSSVAVVVVCTTVEQLATLRHHHDIGLLRDDVQHLVLPTNDGAGDGHVTHAPAARRRLLGDGDDAILDAVIDVVIDHDELELVKTELTQSF